MNVDCDGANNSAGKCSNDPSGQSQTAFQDTLQSYGISDLDASIHSYVVFGNDGGSPTFDPSTAGMKPLSVMAVVCGDNMVRRSAAAVRTSFRAIDYYSRFSISWIRDSLLIAG